MLTARSNGEYMKNEEMALLFSEATPYIQKYHGKTMVIKYGGNAMINETLKNAVMNDLVTLTLLGVRVVLVHGGGPAINEMLKKVGVESHFNNGLRVTDDATMEIVQQVLAGITIGLLLGILAAMRRGSFWDYMVIALSVLLISIPNLIFGLMLQKIFAGNLKVLPTIGWPAGKDLWFGGWEYTILPTLTGCFSYIATYARLLKTSMLDVINQDYVLTAESKGLSRGQIIRRHILRNSFIPVITQLPMSVAMCITGSFFIESIFSIPGIGQYYVTAVNNQDLSIIMGETVIIAALYIGVLFITDLLYVVVDPRISLTGKSR